eukprot:275422_1
MSDYVAVVTSPLTTWTFNALTAITSIAFAYFLHQISKRIPIPFQWDKNTPIDAISVATSNEDRDMDVDIPISKQKMDMNLHQNKCVNKCCVCGYKLTTPTYPSYYFDDTSYGNRKEMLANHWKTLQDQTVDDSIASSKPIFGFGTKRTTEFKKQSCIQYLSLSLRLWSLVVGLIAFILSCSFWFNMLLEYCIACIFNRDNDAQLLGLLAVFPILHCAMWWSKRQFQAMRLLWYNTCDHFNVMLGILWRLTNLFLCLSYTFWSAVDSNLTISDTVFWQLFLRWMVLQGLLWEVTYALLCFGHNISVVYRLYLLKYNFRFRIKLGQSHLKFIKRSIHNVTDDVEEEDQKHQMDHETVFERELHAIEDRQQNILQTVQSRTVNRDGWNTFRILVFALKDTDDLDTTNKIWIYGKYVYVCIILISIIICFAVGGIGIEQKSQCTFAGYSLSMYYLIVLFRRAKYNALYSFWSSAYHAKFYSNLQMIHSFESSLRLNSKRSKPMEQKTEEAGGLSVGLLSVSVQKQKAKIYGLNHKEITVFKDVNRNLFVKTICMDYMDFWSMVEVDDNDFYGCRVCCGATKEFCGLICALVFVMIFVVITVTFGNRMSDPNSSTASVYAHQTLLDTTMKAYPMCQANWQLQPELTMLDLVYTTSIAYYPNKTDITNMFKTWYGSTDDGWQYDKLYTQLGRPTFFHIPHDKGLELVVVRGTITIADILQDISLYTQICTLQLFSWVVPLTTVLPVAFVRDFVRLSAIPEGMIDPTLRERYDGPIYDYVWNNLSSALNTNKTIFIMGHSLGGGIAEIVAAKYADKGYKNVYSFGLSSPGTLWSSSKFGFSVEALDKTSISVLPRRDIVPIADRHGGVVQEIECHAKDTISCHEASRSFCEVYHNCGDRLTRNLTFANCVCGNQTRSGKTWMECL